ncbi:MAG TPA: hydrogen gas-evolving membrane-bound hydrogenase subunit E [Longimicrobiales bacterium]|nr:hydrogen gas-evolving membrane-bound hydrogenase subunit E [Longimicrobiales bacterium]
MGLALAVGSGFILALAAPWVCRVVDLRLAGWLLGLLPLGGFAYFVSVAGPVLAGDAVGVAVPWVPSLGIRLALRLDGLGLIYALLVCGTGTLVFGYAGTFMAAYAGAGRFFGVLLLFTASMLGVVLADDAMALFVFWELTGIASYLLIGFHNERGAARAGAWQALLVTALGGQALLIALILTGSAAGGYTISAWMESRDVIQSSGVYPAALVLLLVGCFAKSALVPFHFWLQSAMQAPAPVSAYLHSAAMVQAGVFLLARMHTVFAGTELWTLTIIGVGAVTMLIGSYLAVVQAAIKAMLAYSTIAMLGASAMLLGTGTPQAIQAALLLVISHALYKSALFMAAGALDRGAEATGLAEVFGLWEAMPRTATATVLAAAAMAGVPPFLGYLVKETAYGAVGDVEGWSLFLVAVTFVAFTAAAAVAAVLALRPFRRTSGSPVGPARDPSASLWLPVAVLAGATIGLGIMPGGAAHLLEPAVAAILQAPVAVELTLWHGFTQSFGLGMASLAAGLALYAAWDRLHDLLHEHQGERFGPGRIYELTIEALLRVARIQTRVLQSGYLRVYLILAIFTTVLLTGYGALRRAAWTWPAGVAAPYAYEVALATLITAAAVAAVFARALVTVVVALGVVGFAVAIVYVLFSAPDLAMTQFLVETVTVILFVMVFYRLPKMAGRASHTAVIRDAVLATAAGCIMTILVLATIAVPREPLAAESFLLLSVAEARGRNVVNTILTDFRALDTFGEVVVLGTAALGVYALVRQARRGVLASRRAAPGTGPTPQRESRTGDGQVS